MRVHARPCAQVVGQLHLEAQFCPFAATGEAAHPDAANLKAQKEAHGHVVRRMTRSNISHQHKGVLTVSLIGASGLTVRPLQGLTLHPKTPHSTGALLEPGGAAHGVASTIGVIGKFCKGPCCAWNGTAAQPPNAMAKELLMQGVDMRGPAGSCAGKPESLHAPWGLP